RPIAPFRNRRTSTPGGCQTQRGLVLSKTMADRPSLVLSRLRWFLVQRPYRPSEPYSRRAGSDHSSPPRAGDSIRDSNEDNKSVAAGGPKGSTPPRNSRVLE